MKKVSIKYIVAIATFFLLSACQTYQSGKLSTALSAFDPAVAIRSVAITVTNELGTELVDPNMKDILESLLATNSVPFVPTAEAGYDLAIRIVSKKIVRGLDTFFIQTAVLGISSPTAGNSMRTVLLKESDSSIDSSILQYEILTQLIEAVSRAYATKPR